MRATADGRANQHARLLGGRKSAKSFEAHQAGEQEAESHSVQLTAKHLSLQNTLAHALPPLPPTFDSSTDPARQQVCRLARLASHYCCKPRLPKVRLSIRGVLNPYILPPPAPDIVPRCTAPSPYGPDCLAAAG